MDQAWSSSSSSHPQQQAEDLLSQLQRLQGGSTAPLPSARQMFSIGSLLYHTRKHVAEDTDMLLSYQHLVDVLPESHWTCLLETLQQAAHRLAVTSTTAAAASLPHLTAAVQALNGLLTNSPRLCQLAYTKKNNNSSSRDGCWVSTLAALYDRIVVLTTTTTTSSGSEDHEASSSCRDTLLATLSSLLLDGLFLLKSTTMEEEILEAIQAMEEQSTDCLGDLQEWQSNKEPFRRTLESQVRKSLVENNEQQAYILKMLASARETKNASQLFSPPSIRPTQQQAAPSKKNASSSTTTVVSPSDELERRIHQVQQILPDFGQGFLEAALSLHQGSVEATVATLLLPASEYPTALRALDTKLPRRHKERSAEEVVEASQARQLTKERLALEAKEEEARYQALVYMADKEQQQQQQNVVQHSEYDDDYDDQYDELDVKLGGADDGQYDFEQVKLYNQLVRTEEKEDSFWQGNLNTNRITTQTSKKSNNKEEDGENTTKEKSWGPDKIKGGRVVGPDGKIIRKPAGQRGKKGGRGNGSAGAVQPSAPPSKEGSTQPPDKNGSAASEGSNAVANKGKPRTKPKSQNRVNRQRDKKQKAQGTFGNSV